MSVPTAVANVVVVAIAIAAAELGSVATAPIAVAAAGEAVEHQRGFAAMPWAMQLFGTTVAVVVIAADVAVAEAVVAECEFELAAVGTAGAAWPQTVHVCSRVHRWIQGLERCSPRKTAVAVVGVKEC